MRNQKEEDLKVQNHMTVLDDNDVSKKSANNKIEDTVSKETAVPDGGKEKCKVIDVDDMIKADVAIGNGLNISALPGQDHISPQDGSLNKLDKSALPVEDQLSPQNTNKGICVLKESNDRTENEDVVPSNTMEADDVVLNGKDLPISVNGSGESTISSKIAPNVLKESTSIGPPEKISQIPEQPKDVDMDSGLTPSERRDSQEVAHSSVSPENKDSRETTAPSSALSENPY